jgi:hypothetical protein
VCCVCVCHRAYVWPCASLRFTIVCECMRVNACVQCAALNYARQMNCFKCGHRRTPGAVAVPSSASSLTTPEMTRDQLTTELPNRVLVLMDVPAGTSKDTVCVCVCVGCVCVCVPVCVPLWISMSVVCFLLVRCRCFLSSMSVARSSAADVVMGTLARLLRSCAPVPS